MPDKMRWRYGDTNPVAAAVASETVIEIGDLLWQDVNQAKPASEMKNRDGCGPTRNAFAKSFLGVAMQRSRAGYTDPIRVATTGVFEFDLEYPTDFELGDLIAPACGVKVGGGIVLANQQIEKVTAARYAVGRCAKRGTSLSTVLVDVRSTVMTGGVAGTSDR